MTDMEKATAKATAMRVLRGEEFDELVHAGRARLRPDLGRERERVLEAAHEQAARLRREAVEAGTAEGRAAYAAQVTALALQREHCWRQIETDLVDVVLACVRRLLGDEAEPGTVADTAALVPRIHALLRDYRPRRYVGLRIAPAALPLLRAALPELEDAHPHVTLFQVIPDPHLDPADFVVETSDAVLDGRLETQIAALREGIAAALHAPDADEAAR